MLRGDRQGRDLRHEVEVSSEISLTLRHQQQTVLGDRDYCIVFEEICAYCGITIFNSNAGGLWVTEE